VIVRSFCEVTSACIKIIDEGPGLPESELDKVFQRFYRAPGDITEGSGLGLAVVRGIAERLGGRAELENRIDRRGLVASVWLPLAEIPQQEKH
jgi:two-component system, OmpR family, sensor kinase